MSALQKIETDFIEYWFINGAKLTPMQKRVTAFLMDGLSNDEIANQLFIDVKTVKYHLTKVYRKTNLTNSRKFLSFMYKNKKVSD